MRFIRGVMLIVLTPLLLCIGVYACTMAHVTVLTH